MGNVNEDELMEIRRELRGLSRQIGRLTMLMRTQINTLLTLDEAALYTGYAKAYLYKLTASGEIPCYRPTKRRVFVDKEELDRWIRKNKI